MIVRAYGRNVAIAHIRDLAGTAVQGTTLAALERAGRSLGFDARAVKVSVSRLDQIPLPAIVHWDGNHWIVLESVNDRKVRVVDPGGGRRTYERSDFLARWSGFTALFGWTSAVDDTPEERTDTRWIAPFIQPHRWKIAGAVLLAVVAAALELVLPVITAFVVDDVARAGNLPDLWRVIPALVVAMLGLLASTGLERFLLSKVAVSFDIATLDFLTGRLLDLPATYFAVRRTGDIERRLGGAQQVRRFFVDSSIQVLTAVATLATCLVLMVIYSPVLTALFLITASAYLLLMRYSSRRLAPMYQNLEESYGRYASSQIDAIRGIETVKSLAAEEQLRGLMMRRFQSLSERVFKSQFLVLAYDSGLQLVTFAIYVVFLVVGAIQVVQGSLSLGEFVAFNSLIALATAPLLVMLGLWDQFQLMRVLLQRLDDVLQRQPEQGSDRSKLIPVPSLEGRISLSSVSFRYGDGPPIIDDVSLDIHPGERVALVGRSGSGKTTLIKLLAALVEVTEGVITFDGVDLSSLDYRSLRRNVGVVLQETYLFDDTIAANIAFGVVNPEIENLRWAARAAAALEFIERLPLGFETKIGESGLALSGGQKQRIAIARALYQRPPVLLFDEATSALDTESERAVKENLDSLLEGRTSVVIAHRLSTIRNADRIVVLDRGRVVEMGTHDQLILRQGLYFHLASQQLDQ
jgi:ATP-binding cassette subfamily B protein